MPRPRRQRGPCTCHARFRPGDRPHVSSQIAFLQLALDRSSEFTAVSSCFSALLRYSITFLLPFMLSSLRCRSGLLCGPSCRSGSLELRTGFWLLERPKSTSSAYVGLLVASR